MKLRASLLNLCTCSFNLPEFAHSTFHMRSNLSEVNIQPWTFYDYRLIDFLQNKTVFCPIKSQWIHFEEYLFTAIGLFITSLVTVRVHATEMRFHDYYALSRCHTMNACLTGLFLISFLFNTHSTETACRWEQVLIQYFSTILIANVFLMAFVRLRHSYFDKQRNDNKLRWTFSIYLISLLVQTLLTVVWLILSRMKPPVSYHRQTCFHRIQIDLCLHAQLPLLFSTVSLPIVFLLTAVNLYRSTRPFAIAQLLESIMCAIGLIMGGSMWYMNLFFSNYPQMPYKYVAYVFLLTYMLPRWRRKFVEYLQLSWFRSLESGFLNWNVLGSPSKKSSLFCTMKCAFRTTTVPFFSLMMLTTMTKTPISPSWYHHSKTHNHQHTRLQVMHINQNQLFERKKCRPEKFLLP